MYLEDLETQKNLWKDYLKKHNVILKDGQMITVYYEGKRDLFRIEVSTPGLAGTVYNVSLPSILNFIYNKININTILGGDEETT